MPLSKEQQDQVQSAKSPGNRRATISFTVEQQRAWRRAVEQELAGKDENLAVYRRIVAAAEEPGFFGDLRRAVLLSRRSPVDLGSDWR